MAGFANETSPRAFLGRPLMWFGASRKGRNHSCTADWWTNRIIKWLQKLLSRLRNLFRTPRLRLRQRRFRGLSTLGVISLITKMLFLIWSFFYLALQKLSGAMWYIWYVIQQQSPNPFSPPGQKTWILLHSINKKNWWISGVYPRQSAILAGD